MLWMLPVSTSALASGGEMRPGAVLRHPVVTSELIVVGSVTVDGLYRPPPVMAEHDGVRREQYLPTQTRLTVHIDEVLKGDPTLTTVTLSVFHSNFPGLNEGETLLLHLRRNPETSGWYPDGRLFGIHMREASACGDVGVHGDGSLISDYPARTDSIPTFFRTHGQEVVGLATAEELCRSTPWKTLLENVRRAVASHAAEEARCAELSGTRGLRLSLRKRPVCPP